MEEQKFEPYQKVLVRDGDDHHWLATLVSHKRDEEHAQFPYVTIAGGYYRHCIPYDGNEHLVGTTDSPKPKWEPKWEPKPGELVAVFDYRDRVHAYTFSRSVKLYGTTQYFTKESWQTVEVEWRYCEPARKHFNIPDEE